MLQQQELVRSTPASVGIAPQAILEFVHAVEREIDALHSFMLLRHGQVVAEGWWAPYAAEIPHVMFSVSKSFTSTAVGLAVEDGLLSVDDAVVSFFPDDLPHDVSPNLAAMQVRHLLSMSTGHAEDTMPYLHQAEHWVQAFLARPVEHEPGTHFLYNTGASYMLSAIVQKLTGMTLLDYLRPRLFEPLGIEGATWEVSPQGISVGGFGLNVTTEALARFGQLYLQKGMWEGHRIVSEAWVAAATSAQVSNANEPNIDWQQGYGYQFWRCRYGAYRGDGAFGQYCVVMPEQDAVLAITGGLKDMQPVLTLVWEHLLPAMAQSALPEDEAAQGALGRRLAALVLPLPAGASSSPTAARVTGRPYRFRPNDQGLTTAAFEFNADGAVVTFHNTYGEQRIVCGDGAWREGRATIVRPDHDRVAAAGAWSDDHTFVAKLYAYETPFCVTVTAHFEPDSLVLHWQENVGFGSTEHPPLEGRAVDA